MHLTSPLLPRLSAVGLALLLASGCSEEPCVEIALATCAANAADHTTFYADRDKDGVGKSDDAKCLCVAGADYTSTFPGDVDDADASKRIAGELCDGADNNGDGVKDEGFFVATASGASLALGAACGAGACADGIVTCSTDGLSAACSTAGLAVAETCNGLDDDCDGSVDEGFPDADADTVPDCRDNCRATANTDQADPDGDGVGAACDVCSAVANPNDTDADVIRVRYVQKDGDFLTKSDCIEPGVVCLSRHDKGPVFNLLDAPEGFPTRELARTHGSTTVEWACGPCEATTSPFAASITGLLPYCLNKIRDWEGMPHIITEDTCLHLKGSNDRWTLRWDAWSESGAGGFAYTRTKPVADGFPTACDNCPEITNASQIDGDSDGLGDACDNCPAMANADQKDVNANGLGDKCEDIDGDALLDAADNCPLVTNADQADTDGDGVGDACDNCPAAANADQKESETTTVLFVKTDYGTEQDCFAPRACLTRGNARAPWNAATDPVQLRIAAGSCDAPRGFYRIGSNATDRGDWSGFMNNAWDNNTGYVTGVKACLRAEYPDGNRDWNLVWQSWSASASGGGFSYQRSGVPDGKGDACDNCSKVFNPDQEDSDNVTVTFENPTGTATEDCLSDDVCFTRLAAGGAIVNTRMGTATWGCGKCSAATVFGAFNDLRASCFAGDVGANIVGSDTCVELAEGVKWDVDWTGYQGGGAGGGFGYVRSRGDGIGDACDVCGAVIDPLQSVSEDRCASKARPFMSDPRCGDACEVEN